MQGFKYKRFKYKTQIAKIKILGSNGENKLKKIIKSIEIL